MGISKLVSYRPETSQEAIARALILKTFREAAAPLGDLRAAVTGIREITDRVEGTAVSTTVLSGMGPQGEHLVRAIRLKFSAEGPRTEVLESAQVEEEEEE